MKTSTNVIILALSAFAVLQFIRPPVNSAAPSHEQTLIGVFPVTEQLGDILRRSCYDCHSNTTRYPWYAYIQPIGWWLDSHIQEGKRELNFDAFGSYRPARQFRKFQDIRNQVESEEMPLPSYLIMHGEARLRLEDRIAIASWADAMRDSMRAWYPSDSLQRRR